MIRYFRVTALSHPLNHSFDRRPIDGKQLYKYGKWMTIRFQSQKISNYKGWHEVKSEEREQSCFALSHDERFLAVPCGSVIKFFDLLEPSTDRALTKAREDNRQWPEEFRLQGALIREVSFSMSALIIGNVP